MTGTASHLPVCRDGITLYFVTVCTQERRPFFGEIVDEVVRLSALGDTALRCWQEIPVHFPHIGLDAYLIMPEQVHGILVIRSGLEEKGADDAPETKSETVETPVAGVVETQIAGVVEMQIAGVVGTQHAASLRRQKPPHPKAGSLSVVVRSYKSAVTRWAGMNGSSDFAWQSRFYDRIIRDEAALARVRAYILANPSMWHVNQDDPGFDLEES